ncbi:MAG: adenine phosphoribosyltransferase [Ruminococcaceae bacterium]|nr:adenine phosphoribosyltransferase [Oscillospiraceae bacterium]
MEKFYELKVAGLKRQLPICKVNDELSIAAFIMFSDVELTVACARDLLKKAPEFDVIVTAEAKGIPLAYEMARQSGKNYVACRKMSKLYMKNPVEVEVQSITTARKQTLFLDQNEMDYLKEKKILIVDDVISTGGSLLALETIVNKAQGNIAGKAAVLAEGVAAERKDIFFLEVLPVFETK